MLFGVGVASFLESTVAPIPLETILVRLAQSQRPKMFGIATAQIAMLAAGATQCSGAAFLVATALSHTAILWLGYTSTIFRKPSSQHLQTLPDDDGFNRSSNYRRSILVVRRLRRASKATAAAFAPPTRMKPPQVVRVGRRGARSDFSDFGNPPG